MAKKIRTGIIRCDTHALWFGCLMAEHDPMLLQRPTAFRNDFAYSWQAGGVHRFFYTNYGDPTEMTAPFVGGFEIVKIWDEHREAAEQARDIFHGVPVIVDSPQQCSEDVDLVFISDCNLDGADHVALATPGLEKGVATFVDKPLAYTVAECRRLTGLAREKRTPLFSASILRFAPAIVEFRDRIPGVGKVNHAIITGGGPGRDGLVHAITFAQHLFGTGIATAQAMSAPKQTAILLDYEGRPGAEHGVMIHTEAGSRRYPSAMGASVIGDADDIHTLVPGGYAWRFGAAEIVRVIAKMLETGESPAENDDMVEAVAVMESIHQSLETGGAVRIEEFLGAGSGS